MQYIISMLEMSSAELDEATGIETAEQSHDRDI